MNVFSHRALVLGYFDELEETPDDDEHAIIDKDGCDIFGQPKEVRSFNVVNRGIHYTVKCIS